MRSVDFKDNFLLYSTSLGTIAKRKVVLQNNKVQEEEDSEDIIMRSHNNGEAWGLAIHKHHIYTCGDDNQLLVWNMKRREVEAMYPLWTKEMEKKDGVKAKIKRNKAFKKNTASTMSSKPVHQQARAIAINTKENHVAIAFNDCKIVIKHLYNLESYLHVLYDPKEWCECLEFNPSQTRLAAGSHDNMIYLYDISDIGYSFLCVLKAHSSYITSIDWSMDGNYIRSNCGAYELLFFDVEEQTQEKSGASNLKNTEWASQNCKLAWNVQGIYPHGTDGTHINGVACLKSHNLIATGDDYGLMNLYRDPCTEDFNKGRSYRGHSEHVVRVKFGNDGKYIVSVGGYDQTIIQWKREGEDTDEDIEDILDEEEEKRREDTPIQDYENYTEDDTDSDEEIESKPLVKEEKQKVKEKNITKDKSREEKKMTQSDEKEESKQKITKNKNILSPVESKESINNSGFTNSRGISSLNNSKIDEYSPANKKVPFKAAIDPIKKTISAHNSSSSDESCE